MSAEDRLEQRKTIVKTLEEYTNDSSTPAEDEIALIQVCRACAQTQQQAHHTHQQRNERISSKSAFNMQNIPPVHEHLF